MNWKERFSYYFLNDLGHWYLQGWFIALMFLLWPLIIPPFVGIALLILQNLAINEYEIENSATLECSDHDDIQDDEQRKVVLEDCKKLCDEMKRDAERRRNEIFDDCTRLRREFQKLQEIIDQANLEISFLRGVLTNLKAENAAFKEQQQLFIKEQLKLIDDMKDGHDFENYLAELLKLGGYTDVIVTKGSGDFGVDVTAKRWGLSFAFQCKRYKQQVGNKAVQEIFAGMVHYNCQIGIVVANNGYTSAAIEQAAATKVLLWDKQELSHLIGEAFIQKQKLQEVTS